MKEKTCCFFGHRTINETEEIKSKLTEVIEKLIVDEKVDTFLFGSKSQFNSLCQETVSKIKEKYPDIKRVYVRAEYPDIDDDYKEYLLEKYEETFFPEKIRNAGRASYVERNKVMIERSRFCVVFYSPKSEPKQRKSGTKLALSYAISKNKSVINICDNIF